MGILFLKLKVEMERKRIDGFYRLLGPSYDMDVLQLKLGI